jgi:outer membrane protein assembly factor BamE
LTLLTVFGLVGCSSGRDRLMRDKYPTYPESIQHAIDRGYLVRGMDHDQVYLALGETICRKTIEHKGRPVEVWLFAPGGRDPCKTAEFRVYFEHGTVTGWDTFTGATRMTVPPGFTEP